MNAPKWGPFEVNLNTLVIVFGFIAGIAAWGGTWQRVTAAAETNRASIERLDQRLTALETSSRRLDNHELRLGLVERQATDAAVAMRAVEASLSALSADLRVVKEILQRLEGGGVRRGP